MEVTEFQKSSKIDFGKVYYIVELRPYVNNITPLYDSYVEVRYCFTDKTNDNNTLILI